MLNFPERGEERDDNTKVVMSAGLAWIFQEGFCVRYIFAAL